MSDSNPSITLTMARRIDSAGDRFESAWPTTERVSIESLLAGVEEAEWPNWLAHLVPLEIELRRRGGEHPSVDEYDRRFPRYSRLMRAFVSSPTTPREGHEADATIGVHWPGPNKAPQLEGYELLDELGRGGMGVVYKARQIALDRIVAVKVIRGAACASDEEQQAFVAEARALGKLQHPHIVSIFEVGEHAAGPYMAMEYVAGGSLSARQGNPELPRKAAQWIAQLAEGIAHAHQQGVIHRDISPSNILLDERGRPKVADFGLVKWLATDSTITANGLVVGTPSYMSPEQASGASEVGPSTDIYGLGAVLYELLTGRPPFRGATPLATIELVRAHDPVPPTRLQPDVPRDIENICLQCLRKEPARRYASALALREDLERFLAGRPVLARPVGPAARTWRWARRNPLASAFATLTGIAIVVGAAATGWQLWRAETALADAGHHRDLYERNYQRASELADSLTRIASVDLAEVPGGAGARRKMLSNAADYYRRAIAERRGDPVLADDLALTLFRYAQVLAVLGETDEAQRVYRESLALEHQILAEQPGNAAAARHAAAAAQNLAGILRSQGPDGLREAVELQSAAVTYWSGQCKQPGASSAAFEEWAKSEVSLGIMLNNQGQLDAAGAHFARALAALDVAPEASRATRAPRLIRVRVLSQLGNLLESEKRYAESRDAHRRTVEVGRECVAQFPDSDDAREELAMALNNLAITHKRLDELDAAGAAYREAIDLHRQLCAAHPDRSVHTADLSRALFNLGRLEGSRTAWEPAGACFEEAGRLHEQLLATSPGNLDHRQKLGTRWSHLATVRIEQGRIRDAMAVIDRRRALWPEDPKEQVNAAREYCECLRAIDLGKGGSEDAAKARGGAVDAAINALRDARRHGWTDIDALRADVGLDPLRATSEFPRVLVEPLGSGTPSPPTSES